MGTNHGPLCCCEYMNRRAERVHVLQLCCACEEFDMAADMLVRGETVDTGACRSVLAEIDDRLRIPMLGGAYHIGIGASLPWIIMPILLLTASVSARGLALSALALLPCMIYAHVALLRMHARSSFLYSWMMASLTLLASNAVLKSDQIGLTVGSASFHSLPLLGALCLLGHCRAAPPSAEGVADLAAACERATRCPIFGEVIPRYDHYCGWIDRPIGSANHRAYIGFIVLLLIASVDFGVVLLHALHATHATVHQPPLPLGDMLQSNHSHSFLASAAYAFAVAAALSALVAHQLSLIIWHGLTAHEARHLERLPRLRGRRRRPMRENMRAFLDQTKPICTWRRSDRTATRHLSHLAGGSDADGSHHASSLPASATTP